MSHTRYRIEQMMGHRVHLILKNGEEYHGILLGRPSSKFGFMVVYDFHLNKDCMSTCRAVDFVLSDIKKIEAESEE